MAHFKLSDLHTKQWPSRHLRAAYIILILTSMTGSTCGQKEGLSRKSDLKKLEEKLEWSTLSNPKIKRDVNSITPRPPYDYFDHSNDILHQDKSFANLDNDVYNFVGQRNPNRKLETEMNSFDDDDDESSGGNWQWCLLTIVGNKTIIQRRRKDFIHYLKMNVASLIGSDYERVIVNAVTYTPDLSVNVTLDWDLRERIVRVLSRVADDRDILLDLSGQHFNLTGFMPSSALLAPKPVAHLEADETLLTAKQIESLVFTIVGVAIAFLLTSSLLFGVCHCAMTARRRKLNENRLRGSQSASTNIEEEVCLSTSIINHSEERRYSHQRQRGPNLIYSPGFSNNLTDTVPQIHCPPDNGRYTPIDDTLTPIVRYDEEPYIPRFVMRSNANSTPNGNPPPPRRQLRFKGEGTAESEDDLAKLMSPNSETDTLLSWPQNTTVVPRRRDPDEGPPRRGTRRNHPYDLTLRPNSAFLYHPPPLIRTELSRNRRASVQNYIDEDDLPTPVLSSFKSPMATMASSTPVKPTNEEIERDVNIVFRNMGIDPPPQYQNP